MLSLIVLLVFFVHIDFYFSSIRIKCCVGSTQHFYRPYLLLT